MKSQDALVRNRRVANNPLLQKAIVTAVGILFFILGMTRLLSSVPSPLTKFPEFLTGMIDLFVAVWLLSIDVTRLSNEFFVTIILMHSFATPAVLQSVRSKAHQH